MNKVSKPNGKYKAPKHGWTCFHCGETFHKLGEAEVHFGCTPEAETGCLLKVERGQDSEYGLLFELRKVEKQRDAAWLTLEANGL